MDMDFIHVSVARLFPVLAEYTRRFSCSAHLYLNLYYPGKDCFPSANQELVDVLMENISQRATGWAPVQGHGKQDPSWPPT